MEKRSENTRADTRMSSTFFQVNTKATLSTYLAKKKEPDDTIFFLSLFIYIFVHFLHFSSLEKFNARCMYIHCYAHPMLYYLRGHYTICS